MVPREVLGDRTEQRDDETKEPPGEKRRPSSPQSMGRNGAFQDVGETTVPSVQDDQELLIPRPARQALLEMHLHLTIY